MVGLDCFSCVRVHYTDDCGTAGGGTLSGVPTQMANKNKKPRSKVTRIL